MTSAEVGWERMRKNYDTAHGYVTNQTVRMNVHGFGFYFDLAFPTPNCMC